MVIIDITDTSASAVHQQMNQFRALVQRFHADPDYRREVEADPVSAFREQGMELPSDIAVRVLANTDDTFYMVLPPDPNMDLGDEMLTAVAGGKLHLRAATFGSVACMGCFACACPASTVSTASSVGTVDVPPAQT